MASEAERIVQIYEILTKQAEQGLDRIKAKYKQTDAETKKATKSSKGFGKELEGLKKLALGLAAAFGFAAIIKGLISSTKHAAEFEKKLAEVTTLLGDESAYSAFGKSLEDVRHEIIEMSGGLGTATELTGALYQAISAGIEKSEALAFVGEAARLAVAGLADAESTVKVLAATLNAYGLEAGKAGEISDMLFQTVRFGVTTVPLLSEQLGTVIPFAATLGVKFNEVAAAMATLTAGGIKTQIAATALRATFSGFIKSADKFAAAGINITKVISEEGFAGALRRLSEVTGGNIKMMQEFVPNIRALTAVLPLTGAQAARFAENLEHMNDAAGATSEAFEKMRHTADFVFKDFAALKSALVEGIGTAINHTVVPALRKFIDLLGGPGGAAEAGHAIGEAVVEVGKTLLIIVTGPLRMFGEMFSSVFKTIAGDSVLATATFSETFIATFQTIALLATQVRIGIESIFLGLEIIFKTIAAGMVTAITIMVTGVLNQLAFLSAAAGKIPGLKTLSDKLTGVFTDARNEVIQFGASLSEDLARDSLKAQSAIANLKNELEHAKGGFVEAHEEFNIMADILNKYGIEAEEFGSSVSNAIKKMGSGDMKPLKDIIANMEALQAEVTKAGGKMDAEFLESLKRAKGALAEFAAEQRKFETAVVSATNALLKQAGVLKAGDIATQTQAFARGIKDTMAILESTGAAGPLQNMIESMEEFREKLQFAGKEASGPFVAALVKAKIAIVNMEHEQNLLATRMGTGEWLEPVIDTTIDTSETLEDLNIKFDETGKKMYAHAEIIGGIPGPTKAAAAATAQLQGQFEGLIMGAESLGGMLGGLGKILGGQLAEKGFGGTAKSLKSLFSHKEGATSGQKFGIGFLGALDSLMDPSKSLGEKLGGAAGAGIGGFFGGPLGAAIGGKIGSFIGGLFGKPAFEKVQDQVKENLGVALSEGTAQAIADIQKSMGVEMDVATMIGLPKIIEEATIAKHNFGQFALEATKGLEMMKGASGEVAEALRESVNESMGALIEKAKEMGTTSTRAFHLMIEGARASGEEIESVNAFIDEGLSKSVENLSTIFDNLGDASKGSIEDLAIITENVAQGLIAQGGDIKELIPVIDQLIEKHKELGLEGSEAYKSLVSERNFLVRNEELLTKIQAEADLMKSLGDTTFMTAEGFSALQREGVRAYDQLIAKGESEVKSMTAVAPFLQNAVNQSLARGEALDAETQKLVDQAGAMGLIETAGTGLTASLEEGFNRVIAAVTGLSIEEAMVFGKMPADAANAANKIAGSFESASQKVAGSAQAAAGNVSGSFASAAGNVAGSLGSAANSAAQSFESAAGSMSSAFASGAASASSSLSSVSSSATKAMSDIGSSQTKVAATMASAAAAAASSTTHIVQRSAGAIEGMISRIQSRLGGLASTRFDIELPTGGGGRPPGRQHGGPAEAGHPYLIGEGGQPEIFIPRTGGEIVPIPKTAQREQDRGEDRTPVQVNLSGAVLSLKATDDTPLGDFIVETVNLASDDERLEIE